MLAGLREEKKLWSQELANQGAALAQDRGQYESKIESLRTQVSELQELAQVERERGGGRGGREGEGGREREGERGRVLMHIHSLSYI